MSSPSYINIIDNYHDYEKPIKALMESILTGIADVSLLSNDHLRSEVMLSLSERYPFVELLYILDEHGRQQGSNIVSPAVKNTIDQSMLCGSGKDRSRRPYFLLARETSQVVITEPYLSMVNRMLSVSAALKITDDNGATLGYLVVDINLNKIISMLMGDTIRHRFQPVFRAIYSVIVLGLSSVVAILLFSAFNELLAIFSGVGERQDLFTKPFTIIIFLTLALAIFDLGKTILEEEVLMHKDVYRHSSTRRTITRFIAAILIAVSIEALLLIFKAALNGGEHLSQAIWMVFAAVSLLVGLGVYVYMGAKAESILIALRKKT